MTDELDKFHEELDSGKRVRLNNLNKGYNFANIEKTTRKENITVKLIVDMNVEETKYSTEVKSSFNLSYWDCGIKEFLKDLKEYCKKPYCIMYKTEGKKPERVNTSKLRDKRYNFSDINFEISEHAARYLKKKKIDLAKEVKACLELQRDITKREYKCLMKEIEIDDRHRILNELGEGKDNYGYYGSGESDKTKTMRIDYTEYNKQMKQLRNEYNKIKDCELVEDMDFELMEKPQTYDEYVKENNERLKNDWEEHKEENDDEDHLSFEDYCLQSFEMNGGN